MLVYIPMDVITTEEVVKFLSSAWCAFFVLHLLHEEWSPTRRILLKIFAKWIEVPLLWFIWVVCRGPLAFLTRQPLIRRALGAAIALPFARYIDTGVPIPAREVMRLIDVLDGPIAVGDCRCRLAKKTCDHPMLTDIVFRTGAEAWLWAFPDNYRVISKDEAKKIVSDCARLGMFQMIFIHCSDQSHVNEYVICNCCECGCKVHLLNRTVGQDYFPLPDGGFRSFHHPEKCKKCEECVKVCPFDAISMTESGIVIIDCFGCGLCELACEQGAYEVRRTGPGPYWSQEAWRELGRAMEGRESP